MTDLENKNRILQARAQALAREPALEVPAAAIDVVEFALAAERYGIETAHVREVFPVRDLTPLPGVPAFFVGIVNVRGRMIAVVDLKAFFGLPATALHGQSQVIILHATEMNVGLLADDVVGVRSVPVSQLQASLPALTGVCAEYLKGVTGERLTVLDAGKLLADPKLIVNEEVG